MHNLPDLLYKTSHKLSTDSFPCILYPHECDKVAYQVTGIDPCLWASSWLVCCWDAKNYSQNSLFKPWYWFHLKVKEKANTGDMSLGKAREMSAHVKNTPTKLLSFKQNISGAASSHGMISGWNACNKVVISTPPNSSISQDRWCSVYERTSQLPPPHRNLCPHPAPYNKQPRSPRHRNETKTSLYVIANCRPWEVGTLQPVLMVTEGHLTPWNLWFLLRITGYKWCHFKMEPNPDLEN